MIKSALVVATLVSVAVLATALPETNLETTLPSATAAAPELLPGAPAEGPYPIGMAHITHGDDWGVQAPPAGQSAAERAAWIMGSLSAQGMTPQEWIDYAKGLPAAGTMQLPSSTLEASMARLYTALEVPVTPDLLAAIRVESTALPAHVAAPLAGLVDVIAAVYEEQAVVAADILERFPTFDPSVPLMTHEQRDATSARAATVLGAIAAFRAATEDAWPTLPSVPLSGGSDPPLFADPLGLVILGGLGDGTYTRTGSVGLGDPVLIVEPSGNDRYENGAGGACPDPTNTLIPCNGLAVSIVADLTGDDVYDYDGAPGAVQGAGAMGGLGILADATGNDHYRAKMTRTNVISSLNSVQYYFDGGAQGYGYFGHGYLIDAVGDDIWEFDVDSTQNRHIWLLGQGFGGGGGLGVAVDGSGTDTWDTQAYVLVDGPSNGFQGVYSMGTGFYAGVGIMMDLGLADDTYIGYAYAKTVDYYAQGFGAFGGVGIMYEDGGNDDYVAGEHGRNPWINPLLNCAYGTGSFGGIGVFLDVLGDDRYYGETVNDRRGSTIANEGAGHPSPAYGLFMDTGGNDEHLMYVFAPAGQFTEILGRGVVQNDNLFGTYLDIGGTDTYVGPGADGDVWTLGADINTV